MIKSKQVTVIAHADWSANEGKRWVAVASARQGGGYQISDIYRIGAIHGVAGIQPGSYLARLSELAGPDGCALLGFDFPIGLPASFAEKAQIESFLEALLCFGEGEWDDFYSVASQQEDISVRRPFYPQVSTGGARRHHLTDALGLEWRHLYRECERPHPGRRAACPLFWTLGGQQVGKAAIHGWRQVLAPALKSPTNCLAIWPFSGEIESLLTPGRVVIVETYPAEFYRSLKIIFSRLRPGEKSGKRHQEDRKSNANTLLKWCERYAIDLEAGIEARVRDGFGPHAWGEDAFDAFIGLIGMIHTLQSWTAAHEPYGRGLRQVEGWIFGQAPNPMDHQI